MAEVGVVHPTLNPGLVGYIYDIEMKLESQDVWPTSMQTAGLWLYGIWFAKLVLELSEGTNQHHLELC